MTGPSNDPARMLALSLTIGGVITIAVAVYLGATIEPLLYLVALVALIDFGLAYAYATGRLGGAGQARAETAAEDADPQAELTEDPSLNPYARED